MGELVVKDRSIVVPGEELAVGMDYLPSTGTYREGERIIALRIGLIRVEGKVLKLVPLSGRYLPKRGDVIIGKVIDVALSGWRFDVNSAYSAMLSLKDATNRYINRWEDLTKYLDFGDYCMASITNVSSQRLIDLSMKGPGLRKLEGGRIVSVNCNKVPRIIGKQGSMVSMIKQATGCKIMVGQNGRIWIEGEPVQENLAVETIKMIEEQSHLSGLTSKVEEHLKKATGKDPVAIKGDD